MRIFRIVTREFTRLMFWFRIIKNGNGTSLKMQSGLILSALLDASLYLICPRLAALPKVYVSGIVYFKNFNVYFYVRGFSDDLYSVMPGREGDVNELILKCLEERDIFIDIGANVGYYSILAGKLVGDKGQVISIEPVANTAEVLKINVKLNDLKNIKVIPKAAWSNRSLIAIYLPENYYGWASPVKLHGGKSVTVEAIPVDIVCKGFSLIN